MDQDKTDPAQRPQTLLEAAKALLATLAWSNHSATDNLSAAIAREEANPTTSAEQEYWLTKTDAARRAQAAIVDRAQQAESTAAWHKAESERLSAELAKAKDGPVRNIYVNPDLSKVVDPTTGFTFATYRRLLEALGGKS